MPGAAAQQKSSLKIRSLKPKPKCQLHIFPKMSNLLSLSTSSIVYLWDCNTRMLVDFLQVCNRRYHHVHDLSKEINHPALRSFSKHMQGVHLNSFK